MPAAAFRRTSAACAAWKCGVAGMVILAIALLSAPPALPDDPADRKGRRGEYLWVKTVHGDFEDVLATIRTAAGSKNFPVTNVRNYKERFDKRLSLTGGEKLPYAQYRVLEVCNVMLGIESLRKDPRMGVFMPCRIVIYSRPGSDEITLMTVNPFFMPRILGNPELESIARRVEEVILEIFDAVDF